MKLRISAELGYRVNAASTIVLNIHALHSPAQTVVSESFHLEPISSLEELSVGPGEGRLLRFSIPEPADVRVLYQAEVDTVYKLTDHHREKAIKIESLSSDMFQYLYPSRYCQSDKLYRFANSKFGKIRNPFDKVLAISNWIFDNVEYLSGSTNASTSAFDTVTELAGVCRDFAHLGIAICRALDIPARYFSGYAYKLSPQDFHACFEAFLGGEWVIFDPTKMVPLNGMVRIGTGRDASDTSIANLYGSVDCTCVNVNCTILEDHFEPVYYEAGRREGLSYSRLPKA